MSPSPGSCWTPSRSGSPPAWRGEVNGTTRNRLAAFDATSGNLSIAFKLLVYNGAGNLATVLTMDVSADGAALYLAATSPPPAA
jgi:hypothetical protein